MEKSSSRKKRTKSNKSSNECKKETSSHKKLKQTKDPIDPLCVSTSQDAENELNKLKHADPVLRLHLPKPDKSSSGSKSVIPEINFDNSSSSSSSSLLEKLLFPLSPKSYMTNCFRQKAVYVSSNDKCRVSNLNSKYMFDLDPKQIFEETSSDSVFLWIRQQQNQKIKDDSDYTNGENYLDDGDTEIGSSSIPPLKSIEIQDPDMAYLLHSSSNYASYCRAPPELEQPLVYNMLKDTGIGCGQYETLNDELSSTSPVSTTSMGRGEVETFIGTKDHVTDWHIDFQENFTIQLSGCKKWTLKQSTLKNPLRGVTPHYKSTYDVIENQLKASRLSNPKFAYGKQDVEHNAFGDEVEIVMNAGDVLYFPAGMWHRVETIEYGVSINISLMGSNFASIVCGAIEHLLLKKDEWREVICNRHTGNAITDVEEGKVVVEKLDKLLGDLPQIIQDFKDNGGAECILPPILRRAPSYVLATEDDYDEDQDDNDDIHDGTNGEHEIEYKEKVSEEKDGEHEEDECDENVQDASVDEDSQVIDLKTFESHNDYDYSRPSPNHELAKNPLAIVMKLSDVTSFDSNTKRESQDENKYIMNVSYAGNEQHESRVRVLFHDDTGTLEGICKIEKDNIGDKKAFQYTEFGGCPLAALFHYGYFFWSK